MRRLVLVSPMLLALAACGGATDVATGIPNTGATSYGVTRVRLGPATDATPALRGPSLLLQGSGPPVSVAVRAHIGQLADAPIDVVVLAASLPTSGSATPECDAMTLLPVVSSCETITIPAPAGADLALVREVVDRAEMVYFAGGDQCRYQQWRGTALQAAVQRVYARGGGVGGGSAGLAILGESVYDGCTGSATSSAVLADPYAASVTFSDGLFAFAPMRGVITDSHLVARDRLGRLVGFVARQVTERRLVDAMGIGVDEGAAIVVDRAARATVYGGSAYLVASDRVPERCERGAPLTFMQARFWRLTTGDAWTLGTRPPGGYVRSVVAGVFDRDPYQP